jgi:hypothetical protein
LVKPICGYGFLADAASGGSTVINGKLFGQTVTEVNRTIYFHYSDHENARVLNNNRIVKTFADNADEADINATLPGFYRTPGRELSLMIDEYRGPGFLPRQTSLRFTVVKTRRKNRSHTLDRIHSQISFSRYSYLSTASRR